MATTAVTPESDDPLLRLDESAAGAPRSVDAQAWRVLIVDDDADVHLATELAMQDVLVEGRGLRFLHAHSAAQALAQIAADAGLAVVLLDVVMETPDAGLQLVRQIRELPGRAALRIILRTGQPGHAPEIETLRGFDINDYRTKSELTRVRLFASLTAAVRAYAQLCELTQQRDDLAQAHAALLQSRAAERAEAEGRLAAETALRLANETLAQCVDQRTHELSQVITELEGFNRMVSHDLRGPLYGLAGLSGLIQREIGQADPAEIRRWLGMMENQTRRLAELVGDLLSLSRVSRGTLEHSRVALNNAVQDALQTLALKNGPECLAAVSVGTLPELDCDAGLMRQVFVNLLSNALKFTRDAVAPRIEVRAERMGGEWTFTVQDNGVGFDGRRAAELFKPFARLHEGRFGGSGIGLTIVQRIVARHGGRIWAESRPGGGASFHFTLPGGP